MIPISDEDGMSSSSSPNPSSVMKGTKVAEKPRPRPMQNWDMFRQLTAMPWNTKTIIGNVNVSLPKDYRPNGVYPI